MTFKASLTSALAMTMAAMLFAPRIARADQFDKKIVVSFNKPVEIPDLVLEPGTYVFRLANHGDIPNLVQVFNEDETRIYASRFTISKYRDTVTDQPFFEFEERNEGQPMAIDAWFYPGEDTGYEFVYSKNADVQSAAEPAANVTPDDIAEVPAPSEPPEPPEGGIEAVQIIAFFVVPDLPAPDPDAAFANRTDSSESVEVTISARPNELPKTASHLPLLALFGMLLLGSAVILQGAGRLSAYFARK